MNETPSPPKFFLRFFRWFCCPEYLEDIEGDLMERFKRNIKEKNSKTAKWRFAKDTIQLFRIELIRSVNPTYFFNHNRMILHFIKIAFRNILKDKTYSIINILGLIIGMAAVLLLAKYVGFSFTYDNFHQNSDRIFTIYQEEVKDGIIQNAGGATYYGVAQFVQENYSEIAGVTHYNFNVEALVTAQDKTGRLVKFNERKIFSADSSFFHLFSFKFIHGNSATALSEPGSVVITASTAKRYFKDVNVLGESFTLRLPWGEKKLLHVSGIIEDIPLNSKFQFDFLSSAVGILPEDNWQKPVYKTIVLLDQKSNPKQLAKKLTHDIQTLEVFQSHQKDIQIALEPIKGNLSNIEYMLAIVGIFILLVTWINFINLAGAKALGRFKEMGVRKVLGSVKSQIIRQFVFEGLLLNIIGLMCALGIVFLIFPYLRIFTNNRVLPLNEWQTFINPLFLLVFFIGAVITSLYPAIILAGLNPIDALKGKIFQSTHKVGFRKTLVIFQFSISIVLMIGVFIISDQMRFIQNQDLGIDLSRTLIVKTAKDGWNGKVERLKTFKTEVEALSTVEGTASSTMTPGGGNGQDVSVKLEKHNEMLNLHLIGIDANFINQYELEVLAGEPFEKDQFWKNKKGIIINKTAAKKLGYTNFDELISQKIIQSENGGKVYEILAVIDDYHHQSLKEDIPPLIFQFNSLRGHISVKLNAINYQDYEKLVATIKDVEAIWNKTYSDLPFDYYFLDESFNAQYVGDIRFRKIFEVFTTISVFIACLGLFGLSLFVSMKRKKEVGIRKTYGASSVNILGLFTKDYLIQIFVAILIGTPVAYFFMEKWLENYSFKTAIHGTSLFIPIVLLVLISLSCVAFQTVKAAFANPIKTLKNE